MIAIKSAAMNKMPEFCDDCVWMCTRPHPDKGWTDGCELMNHCTDDDQPEEWIYDGNSRPKACPLIEIRGDERLQGEWIEITNKISETETETHWECSECHNPDYRLGEAEFCSFCGAKMLKEGEEE